MKAAIKGVGGWLPPDVLTNADLEKLVDTTEDWILTRTGIEQRHILRGEGKGVSTLAINAVNNLLEKTNTDPASVDLLLLATVSADYIFPATANVVATETGMKNAWSYDIEAACSGFLFALRTGSSFIESGMYKKVVVVGADKMSTIIDYTDRATCILFGDGGGAVLLEADEEMGIMDGELHTDGSGRQYLYQIAGGSKRPPSIASVQNREHYVLQEGRTVFKFAVQNMADVAYKIMERNNLTPDDIAYLVPHQANKRIIDATAERMGLAEEKVMVNIHRYGNTTCGTLPLCLYDWEDKLKRGDNLILAAFGGGFSWGSIWLKWAY